MLTFQDLKIIIDNTTGVEYIKTYRGESTGVILGKLAMEDLVRELNRWLDNVDSETNKQVS